MSLTAWLDVAIGLGIVYLGASLFVTVLSEQVSQLLNLRGEALYRSLKALIPEAEVREKLAGHPALRPLFTERAERSLSLLRRGYDALASLGAKPPPEKPAGRKPSAAVAETRPPSYVDPTVLARALVAVDGQPAVELPGSLGKIVADLGARTNEIAQRVSGWLDASLTMLSEDYKRAIREVTFVLGVLVAVALNIDTLAVTSRLYHDKEARDAAVALATDVTSKLDPASLASCTRPEKAADPACAPVRLAIDAVRMRSASLATLPIGWGGELPAGGLGWLSRVVGWFLTALALSLGAPFWFDLLTRLVNIRSGMRKPEAPSPAPSAPAAPGAGAAPARARIEILGAGAPGATASVPPLPAPPLAVDDS